MSSIQPACQHPREVTLPCCPLHVCPLQLSEAPIVVEMLDQVALALVHKNGAFVQLKDSSLPFNLFQYLVASIRCVNDLVCFVICRPNADMFGRKGTESIVTVIKSFFIDD